jgi:putative NADH-flavin reductase
MQLAILGATGRVGGHVLSWALDAGHPVTALARNPEALHQQVQGSAARGPAAGLTVIRGDALDETAVAEVIAGADAVLSALGPHGAKAPGLLAGSASNIVSAMRKTGARRLICISAAGAYVTEDPDKNWPVKLILPRIFAKQFADTRRMEDVIRGSDLDWTLVRPSMLVSGSRTGQYRVSPDYPPRGGWKISRADVADLIATAVTEDRWLRSAPAVAY